MTIGLSSAEVHTLLHYNLVMTLSVPFTCDCMRMELDHPAAKLALQALC